MYNVLLYRGRNFLKNYDVLFGKTEDKKRLSQEECEKILSLPVKQYENLGRETAYWLLTQSSSRDILPVDLEYELKNRYLKEQSQSFNTDIDLIKIRANRQKAKLEQSIESIRQEVTKIKNTLGTANDRLEELKIQKQLNVLKKDLRKKEEGLFLEKMCIDVSAEDEIEKLYGVDGIEIKVSIIFKLNAQ